jgi:hypothetical protein
LNNLNLYGTFEKKPQEINDPSKVLMLILLINLNVETQSFFKHLILNNKSGKKLDKNFSKFKENHFN